jgi:hypothetical protein
MQNLQIILENNKYKEEEILLLCSFPGSFFPF